MDGGRFHPCLSVCEQDISKSYSPIRTKFGGEVGCVTRMKCLNFGEDLDPDLRILKVILHHWVIGLKRYTVAHDNSKCDGWIRPKLSGWVCYVTRTSSLNFSSGPNPDPANQWHTKGKLISLVEVCALPSAVPVRQVSLCEWFFICLPVCLHSSEYVY